jgi:hypothetical protein
LERFGGVDVEDEDAAVGAAVEGDAEGLETFLACGVPELVRRREEECAWVRIKRREEREEARKGGRARGYCCVPGS